MSDSDNSDKPWVSNYPPLKEWLDKIHARCMWQVPYGPRSAPTMYIEAWHTDQRIFIVTVHAGRNGWDIYTAADTNVIAETLADAEERLGIGEPKPSAPPMTATLRLRGLQNAIYAHDTSPTREMRETLARQLIEYELTGDHNHGGGPVLVGMPCSGGDCLVHKARQSLMRYLER